jgi:hypothetical protein
MYASNRGASSFVISTRFCSGGGGGAWQYKLRNPSFVKEKIMFLLNKIKKLSLLLSVFHADGNKN